MEGISMTDLRGGRQLSYKNSLGHRRTESLRAACDTFVPFVDVPDSVTDEPTAAFYRSSASMAGTPDRVAGLLCERLQHPKKWLVLMALWLLSTPIGTLVLCGRASFSHRFPFFQKFSQISQEKREIIILSWSHSSFYLLRMLFKVLKILTLFVFFTQVDDKNYNLTWRAIGYPGPDPELSHGSKKCRTPKATREEGSEHKHESMEAILGPLYTGLINMKCSCDIIANSLQQRGFPVSVHGRESQPALTVQCDAVVVGSGSGGSVVAGVLAQAGHKVLIIEKGDYFARSSLSLLEGPSLDQMYLSSALLATEDMDVTLLAGSTLGGGSTINWSASIKTPEHVTNEWREKHGLELFASESYQEALNIVCEKMGVQSECDEEGFSNAILRRGCRKLGYPIASIPRNSSADHYCGWCCFGCKDGKKKGTCETWLKDAVTTGHAAILPNCEATKVLHRDDVTGKGQKMAIGVAFEFCSMGSKCICTVEARVTIAACGALCTPYLLKQSGLKNPNIGKNLHLHPVMLAWGYFPEEEKNSYEGGIMTTMSTAVSDFQGSGYGPLIQTPSLHPGVFSSLMPWLSGAQMKRQMCRFSKTAHFFSLVRDRGSGTVRSPTSIGYKMEDVDEENLQRGFEKLLRIMVEAGAEEIGSHNCEGKILNVKKASVDEVERFVREESRLPVTHLSSNLCSAHQMGSCRMGTNPKNSVVKYTGETWEMEGLFLADTSVFPSALGVNPMVTVQAIAYCTANAVLHLLDRKRSSSF